MASPFQQQARQRKFLYLGLILVLFTASWAWRRAVIDGLAERLVIREELRGEVELTGAFVRLGLTGSRGLVTCMLWNTAIEKQKRNQWNELEVLVRSLTRLQPHFITPWLFQSWNLAYNVSVESDRVRDKYFYVSRGIELLAEGERQNANHPDLRWSVGFYLMHKINHSDETNYQRSLLQLSLIPPNERNPARFWVTKQDDKGAWYRDEFNWAELEAFCRQHPQLARRLKEGITRETARERRRQFTCERPEDVVRFLEENYQVPSFYKVEPLPAGVVPWDPNKRDALVDAEARFPSLPPPHQGAFDPEAMTTDSAVRDETDGYFVSHAWYSYAQEPLPPPHKVLPGNSETMTDRARQRRPKHMTTLIFRNYPAQALRYNAERLQSEGWYDDDAWDAGEWFSESAAGGKEYRYGGGKKWSLEAWKRAARAWEKHGEENLLLFPTPAKEQDTRDLAARFGKRYKMIPGGAPPILREDEMNEEEKREYLAARILFEYDFYRRVSNFGHHLARCRVESKDETVAVRKLLYQAEQLDLSGSFVQAVQLYVTPRKVASIDAWRDKELSPLDAWRDLVLLKNKDFRRDSWVQEQSAEYELRYLRLYNRQAGRRMKEDLVKMAGVLPLVPVFNPDAFAAPIVVGPYDRNDDEGHPLVEDGIREVVLERMGLSSRRREMAAPPPTAVGPDVPSMPRVPPKP